MNFCKENGWFFGAGLALGAVLSAGGGLRADSNVSRAPSVRELCSKAPIKRNLAEACAECAKGEAGSSLLKNIQAINRDALRTDLGVLFNRYGSKEARKKNPSGYLNAIKAVLQQTPTGNAVLKCFYQKPNEKKFVEGEEGPKILWTEGAVAHYASERDSNDFTRYRRVLKLPLQWSPKFLLMTVLHEMKHGCGAEDGFAADDPSQFAVLDEFRAYLTEVQFFKELAGIAPRMVCDFGFRSSLFEKQLTSGGYHALLEEKMISGTFVDFLVRAYSQMPFELDQLFMMGEDGKPLVKSGHRVVRDDVNKMIRDATGFDANPKAAR